MPKCAVASTPCKLSKAVAMALKTIKREARARKKKRGKPRMKILAPRHVSKTVWATRPVSELAKAKAKLKSLACNKKFTVPSASSEGKVYQVVCAEDGAWSCACPDFKFRHSTDRCQYGFYCKHIAVCIDKLTNKN